MKKSNGVLAAVSMPLLVTMVWEPHHAYIIDGTIIAKLPIMKSFNLQELPRLRGGRFYRDIAAYGHFGRTDIALPWEDVSQKAKELSLLV